MTGEVRRLSDGNPGILSPPVGVIRPAVLEAAACNWGGIQLAAYERKLPDNVRACVRVTLPSASMVDDDEQLDDAVCRVCCVTAEAEGDWSIVEWLTSCAGSCKGFSYGDGMVDMEWALEWPAAGAREGAAADWGRLYDAAEDGNGLATGLVEGGA